MPIGEDEWERGKTRDTLEHQILDFLQNEKPTAYSDWEIAHALNRVPPAEEKENLADYAKAIARNAAAIGPVQRALTNLVEEGKVEKRNIEEEVGETEYYRAR